MPSKKIYQYYPFSLNFLINPFTEQPFFVGNCADF